MSFAGVILVSGLALFNGNDLHKACTDGNKQFLTGYVGGTFDMLEGAKVQAGVKSAYCKPRKATLGQLVDITCKWLKENPAQRHRPAALVANMALAEAYPCE